MVNNKAISVQHIWDILNKVPDPEVPAISVVELGVIRNVSIDDGSVLITMTPTYSGCPALKAMEDQMVKVLSQHGIENVQFKLIYKPAWTTDWMSDETKNKLEKYGIAPPGKLTADDLIPFPLKDKTKLHCPFCHSDNTKLTSQFGSTACKSLHYCNNCNQPFEHFKCH
jgi:ring-1,2-phenylacetyl-CoA epoxidase subunit PaaD